MIPIKTQSSTPIEPVMVEDNHIWLRKNIVQETKDNQLTWIADEIVFDVDNPLTIDEISGRFEELWSEHSMLTIIEDPEQLLIRMEETMRGFTTVLLQDTGRSPGEEYVEPTGYHDAYPKEWIVTSSGKKYKATRDGANGIPGESPDWLLEPEEGEIPAWVPVHAGSEYPIEAIVQHVGYIWRNDLGRPNGWEPGTTGSQWTKLGPT